MGRKYLRRIKIDLAKKNILYKFLQLSELKLFRQRSVPTLFYFLYLYI